MKILFTIFFSLFSLTAKAQDVPTTQFSIDTALFLFSIQEPKEKVEIKYDPLYSERGLTIFHYSGKIEVLLGKAAFASMEILGSTLAHELEIHCRQDWKKILTNENNGKADGFAAAEIEAYQYELDQKLRFNLSSSDLHGIKAELAGFTAEEEKRKKDNLKKELQDTEDFLTGK